MADNSSASTYRDYRGTKGAVDDADGTSERRRGLTRGRTGVSRPKSPRPGVRHVDPESAREGRHGEPEYGAPMDAKKPQESESEKRKRAKPDPLKPKE